MSRFFMPRADAFDANGNPRVGGRLEFYATGTNTPKPTYSDAARTVPNTNPVIANAAGVWGDIFLEPGAYKVVQRDAAGNLIWTADPVEGPNAAFEPFINVRNAPFNAQGNNLVDDTAAIQAALDTGRDVYLPKGNYWVSGPLSLKVNGQRIFGEGGGAWMTVIEWAGTGDVVSGLGLQYAGLETLHIRRRSGASTLTSGHAVVFGPNGATPAFQCFVKSCRFEGTGNGISLQGSLPLLEDVKLRNLSGTYGVRLFGTSTTLGTYGAVIRNLTCDNPTGPDTIDWVRMDSFAYSVSMDRGVLLNGARGVRMMDTLNTGSSFPMWFETWNLECDNNELQGVQLDAGEGFKATTSWIGSCTSGAGILVGTNWRGEAQIVNSRIMGNGLQGVLVNGGVDLILNGNVIADNSASSNNTFDGVFIAANVSRFQIIGNRIGEAVGGGANRQRFGIGIAGGTTDNYVVLGNILIGNVSGTISDSATGTNRITQGTFNNAYSIQAPRLIAGAPSFHLTENAGDPVLNWDSNDFIGYTRASNIHTMAVGGVSLFTVSDERVAAERPLRLPTYTLATLPSASVHVRSLIYVSDGSSNRRLAVSDGTNWRWPDGAIVS